MTEGGLTRHLALARLHVTLTDSSLCHPEPAAPRSEASGIQDLFTLSPVVSS